MKKFFKELEEISGITAEELKIYWDNFIENYSNCEQTEELRDRFLIHLEDLGIVSHILNIF